MVSCCDTSSSLLLLLLWCVTNTDDADAADADADADDADDADADDADDADADANILSFRPLINVQMCLCTQRHHTGSGNLSRRMLRRMILGLSNVKEREDRHLQSSGWLMACPSLVSLLDHFYHSSELILSLHA